MRARGLGLLVVACLVAAACSSESDGGGQAAGTTARPRSSTSTTTSPTTTSTTTSTTVLPPLRPDGTVPGGRPPQFVVVSFDGAGNLDLLQHWLRLGQQNRARFTFFLSGVYLLDDAHRKLYQGPGHDPGVSSVGFANPLPGQSSEQYLDALVVDLLAAKQVGNEVGTHYNGHFCSGVSHPVGDWSADDWRSELDQFKRFAANIAGDNGLSKPVPDPTQPGGVVGGRTPCLEGNMDALYPVLKERGFRYDASRTGSEGEWPVQRDGIWSFTLDSLPVADTNRRVLSMDYNFYFSLAGAKPVDPDRAKQLSDQVERTYLAAFERSYHGNRAPIDIGNHFEHWDDSAYTDALGRFVQKTCTRPEVRCVSYRDLADWLDARTPAQLAAFQAGFFPHLPAG